MIEQTLTVSKLKDNTAWLVAEQKPACEGCNGKCGSQVFSKLFGTHKKALPIPLTHPLQVGQKVKLALDDSQIVQHALWVYLLPLIMAFVGMFGALLLFRSLSLVKSPVPWFLRVWAFWSPKRRGKA